MLPKIAAENLADYIDAFLETGYFSVEETIKIMKAGIQYGLEPKIHVNQFTAIDGITIESVIDRVQLVHEGGKIAVKSRVELNSLGDVRKIYTPGVASICRQIQQKPELAERFTSISNSVAIVTNGTAILGLGDIGPVAGMPVMEGKAVLFDKLVGISGGGDWTATVPRLEYPYLQRIYGFYGATDKVSNVHLPQERHDFGPNKRNAVYDFFIDVFGLDRRMLDESKVTIESENALKSFGEKGEKLPAGALRYKE
jgi:hypothetical protein